MTFNYALTDPELEMAGGEGERFVAAGSNLNLTCYIRQAADGERKVLKWTRNDQVPIICNILI